MWVDETTRGARFGPPYLAAYVTTTGGGWLSLPPVPHAIARYASPAVWTGEQLLIWGQPSEALTSGT